MICLDDVWIYWGDVFVWSNLEEVIICDLLLSGGPRVMIINLSVAHLLIVNRLRVNIKDVLHLIWILNGLRRLIASLSLFNLLGTSSNRWLSLLLLVRLLVLVLLYALLVDYRHFGVSRALKDAPAMSILLWYARVLSIILKLWTKQVHNFIFIVFGSHKYHLMAPYHLFFLLLRNDLVSWHLIGHLCIKFVIVMVRLGV